MRAVRFIHDGNGGKFVKFVTMKFDRAIVLIENVIAQDYWAERLIEFYRFYWEIEESFW